MSEVGTEIPANMAEFSIDEVAAELGTLSMGACSADRVVGVCTDSRKVRAGNLFVALVGKSFDGHDHIRDAVSAGAVGVVVSKDVSDCGRCAVFRVGDTEKALGKLGRAHRRRWAARAVVRGFPGKVVAVTGSAGKTTTCRAIKSVLEAVDGVSVHVPVGNMNNAIGIPMVLLGLLPEHGYAVVEVGTNSPGEIEYGGSLVEPDVAVLTNVGCAHTAGLGTIDAVAEEKGALYSAVRGGGVWVANSDDFRVMEQVKHLGGSRVITYGTGEDASIRKISNGGKNWCWQYVLLSVPSDRFGYSVRARIPVLGKAGVYASAAALATLMAVRRCDSAWEEKRCLADMEWYRAERGFCEMEPEKGRLRANMLECGAWLIDDSYNANPPSMAD
ncbi:MAG: UDP-N-acetylmuramoyl-tripeptide--D-alanyl-D-alanine ligase [Polyangiaceae bacterium]|nr:UDP-N-acetylmuramoyl-tripeptide--D-alanyl-D-alanine ligase [Polyangiaceae bacterium]